MAFIWLENSLFLPTVSSSSETREWLPEAHWSSSSLRGKMGQKYDGWLGWSTRKVHALPDFSSRHSNSSFLDDIVWISFKSEIDTLHVNQDYHVTNSETFYPVKEKKFVRWRFGTKPPKVWKLRMQNCIVDSIKDIMALNRYLASPSFSCLCPIRCRLQALHYVKRSINASYTYFANREVTKPNCGTLPKQHLRRKKI